MLKAGITGGIGSGKTTACRMFEDLGIPVYNSDDRAKYLMNHEHFLIDQIKKHFGEEAYEEGKINRTYLAEVVFNKSEKLALLNSLVHPAVFRDAERWQHEQEEKGVAYTLREAALLVETGSYKKLDALIVVTAPADIRIRRILDRDKTSEKEVHQRIKNQLDDAEKLKLADYIIVNDGNLIHLQNQVFDIHQKLLKRSESNS